MRPVPVFLVGNVMIDTLRQQSARLAEKLAAWSTMGLPRARYAVATLHRPSNVDDDGDADASDCDSLSEVAELLPVVFPVHPRTRARLEALGLPMPDGCGCASRCRTASFSAC